MVIWYNIGIDDNKKEVLLMQCKGIKKDGSRCTREQEQEYCYQHRPRERIEYSDMTLEQLKEEMTEKQKAFADYYITSDNATQSAIKAGYSKDTAYSIGPENLKKPVIAEYLSKRLESKEKKRIASQDEVLEFLTDVMRGMEKDNDNAVDIIETEGAPVPVPTIMERTKAAKLLGERYGTFVKRQQHEFNKIPKIIDDID